VIVTAYIVSGPIAQHSEV